MSTPGGSTLSELGFVCMTRSTLGLIEQAASEPGFAAQGANLASGILVGGRIREQNNTYDLLIVSATSPAEQIEPTPGALTPEAPDVQQHLRMLRARYPRMDYMGIWRVQDPAEQDVTQDDARTASTILLHPSYDVQEMLYALVQVQQSGDVYVRYFYMSREMAGRNQPFAEVDDSRVYLIDDDDPLAANERTDNGMTPTGTPLPPLPDRIDEEFRRLTAQGYQVKVREQDQSYQFAIKDARLPATTIYLTTSPGYPAAPPGVLIIRDGQRVPLGETETMLSWTVHRDTVFLVDVANEIMQQLLFAPPPAAPAMGGRSWPPAASDSTPSMGMGGPERRQSSAQPLIVAVAALLAVLALLFLGWWLLVRPAGQTVDYEQTWQLVDRLLREETPGEAELLRAIEGLETIRRTDPLGEAYERNADAIPALTRMYVQLGDYYMRQQPPDLEAADASYTAALGLTSDDPAALAGRQQVQEARAEQAVEQAFQQTINEVWEQINTSIDPAEQVRLIEALQLRGVESDPAGTPIENRLYEARISQARQNLADQDYVEARTAALAARNNAPNDELRQEATNLLAQTYLNAAGEELDNGRLPSARNGFNSVLALDNPQASADLRNQAQQGLDQVEAAETQLDNVQRVNQGWQSYDAAIARQDWDSAILALDSIKAITGPTPETVDFPSPPYDPRTYNVDEIQAQARVTEAERLQRAGNLDAAQVQYEAVLAGGSRVTPITRQNAETGLARLAQARELWNTVNAARAAGNWQQMRETLLTLRELPAFGPQARNPATGETVDNLIRFADSQLANPTPAPTAPQPSPTETTEPTAAPEASATATVAPSPTSTSIPDGLPPTTLPLPSASATTAPATAEPSPTSTPEPEPSPTSTPEPEPSPTSTPDSATPLETYTYPSGLFSIDVPTTWQQENVSGSGQARAIFTAPGGEYSVSVTVEQAPEGAAQADLETAAQDFATQTFGTQPGFTTGAATTQPDGSVVLPFSYTRSGEGGATITVPGEITARLDGDKFSFLVPLFNGGEEAQTQDRLSLVTTMIESYQITPGVSLP